MPVGLTKLPPFVGGKNENPHCFTNVRKFPTKYVTKRSMGYMNHLHCLFKGTLCQYGFPAERFFPDQRAAHPQDIRYLRV
jgi:hypothetical protein